MLVVMPGAARDGGRAAEVGAGQVCPGGGQRRGQDEADLCEGV